MRKNKTWIILLAIVLTITMAYFAYNALSDRVQSDRLSKESDLTTSNDQKNDETENTRTETENTSQTDSEEDEDNVKIPEFTVTDYSGSIFNITEFFGKPIVINFWASWCPPCVGEMPDFHKIYKELGEEIQFIMINVTDGVRETKEIALKFITKNDYTFPVYYDIDLEASSSLGIYSYPTTLFIDSEGYVITGAVGAINEELLRKGIDMIR